MARLNIEDSLWSDPRFQELLIKVGSRHTAKGMILELWTVAQKFWISSGGKGIPKPAWVECGLPQELIDCRLARDDGDFIYAIGSKEQFAWLNQRSDAGRENKGKSNERRKSESNGRKRVRSSSSSSSSFSFSSSFSDSGSNSELKSSGVAHATSGKTVATWEAYRRAYQKRYGEPPIRNAAINGKLGQLVNRLGAEEAPFVAEFYLTHNAYKYVNAGHSIGLLLMDAEKLRTEWATGNKILGTQARELERRQHNSDSWDQAAEILNQRRKVSEAV